MTYVHRRAPIEIDPALLTPRDLRAWRISMWAPRPRQTSTGPQQDAHIVTRVMAKCHAINCPPSQPEFKAPPIVKIRQVVAEFYGVTVHDMISARRTVNLTWPRHVSVWLCRHMTLQSYPQIAVVHGRRDHTFGLNSVRRVDARLAAGDEKFRAEIEALRFQLGVSA